MEEAAVIARYARKVLIEKYGDQATFVTQISDLVEGAVDRALRELATPLPANAEPLAKEGLRHYAMQARTAQEARETPADSDGRPVPGGPVTRQDVAAAFTPDALQPSAIQHSKKFEDEWLM